MFYFAFLLLQKPQRYILWLFYDNDLRNKLIKLGSENVKNFTWKNTALNTLNVYQKVIKENKLF